MRFGTTGRSWRFLPPLVLAKDSFARKALHHAFPYLPMSFRARPTDSGLPRARNLIVASSQSASMLLAEAVIQSAGPAARWIPS